MWANPVVHGEHKLFLRREVEQTLAVKTAESYDDGIASTPNIVVDHYQNGKEILLKSTRRKLHIAASKKRPFTVDRTTELPEEKYKKRCQSYCGELVADLLSQPPTRILKATVHFEQEQGCNTFD